MDSGYCVFCEDIIRQKNAAFVYEDEATLAFMDYAPVEEGHVLVIPKKHFENVLDIDRDNYLQVHIAAKKISPALLEALHAEGLNIGQNNGPCANQIVPHYHLHLIPRWCSEDSKEVSTGGRFSRKTLNWERKVAEMRNLESTAALIRSVIKRMYG